LIEPGRQYHGGKEAGDGNISYKDRIPFDNQADNILSKLEQNKVSILEPIFDSEIGYTYRDLGKELDLHEQLKILHYFERTGLVTSKMSESVLSCPGCGSTKFSVQLYCTVCKSSNITKGAVIEHLVCGNIDFDSKYEKGQEPNVLNCPKCGKKLKAIGVDYARPGTFCKCLNCKALFPQADGLYICLSCKKESNLVELDELQLMTYVIDWEKSSRHLFAQSRLLLLVADTLNTEFGIKAMSPGKVRGLSNVEHDFDLLILDKDNNEPILAADLVVPNERNNSGQLTGIHILAFYAKCLDANYSTSNVLKKILVTGSELSGQATELADAYGITVIHTKEHAELTSIVMNMISKVD
jgi:hypothetical protein